jgi:hypothetical protein
MIGCSSDDDPPPTINITGAWATTTWITAYVPGPTVSVSWNVIQNGSALYGSFTDSLKNGGSISGSVTGNKAFMTFIYTYDPSRTVDYEATAGTNVLSGVFRGAGEVKLGNANRLLTQ